MYELIYVLTVIYVGYVLYIAEGDSIVACIQCTCGIELQDHHARCSRFLNNLRAKISQFTVFK